MTRKAYYNEIDPNAAAWLRELIKAGHIADGEVDTRSIEDVTPDDLRPFTQCHFFAGIGGWSLALRMAGWDDSRPVWTGSCPCQPFSAAGKGEGFSDERHLWPAFYHLIEQCGPASVFGEQVASRDGLDWLDLVRADLEGSRYAFGAADLCAAGFGAPHIRQRLFWVAHAEQHHRGRQAQSADHLGAQADRSADQHGGRRGASVWLGNPDSQHPGRDAGSSTGTQGGARLRPVGDVLAAPGAVGGLADAAGGRDFAGVARADQRGLQARDGRSPEGDHPAGPTNGFWRDADWLGCRDGKWRPVEPGAFPLAHGLPARVGRLRGYGNAIVPEVAAAFVRAAS